MLAAKHSRLSSKISNRCRAVSGIAIYTSGYNGWRTSRQQMARDCTPVAERPLVGVNEAAYANEAARDALSILGHARRIGAGKATQYAVRSKAPAPKDDRMSTSTANTADDGGSLPRNCTFLAPDWQILAKHWYPVALAREVDASRPVAAMLLDEPLVVYRSGEEVVVANDLCPHRGVPLSLGKHDDTGVRCAYHGLHFGAGGRCDHIPAHPGSDIPARLHLRTYPAVERYGLIWTCLRPDGPDGAQSRIPAMPHWDDIGFQQIVCPSIDIFGFAGRQMEGF